MYRCFKRFISIFLAVALLCSSSFVMVVAADSPAESEEYQMALTAYAVNIEQVDISDTICVAANTGTVNMTLDEYNEFVTISPQEAEIIAMLFVQDMIALDGVLWNENTYVTDVIEMYDASEEGNVTAYTVELNEGYVVVSRFLDSNSMIPEWSDSAKPLYTDCDLSQNSKIIYLGLYEYYVDADAENAFSMNGDIIDKSLLVNEVDESRSVENIPTVAVDELIMHESTSSIQGNASTTGYITDPYVYANANYAGPFSYYYHVNLWEDYATYWSTAKFNNVNDVTYTNHCGPTAITNLVCMYERKYLYMTRGSLSAQNLFSTIAQYGLNHAHYTKWGGTTDTGASMYLRNIFSTQLDVDVSTILYYATFDNLKSSLANGSLMYLMLHNNATYNNHHLIGFAYTRLRSDTTGWYKTFIKVIDGHAKQNSETTTNYIVGDGYPRYIDIATLASNDMYYEVIFP